MQYAITEDSPERSRWRRPDSRWVHARPDYLFTGRELSEQGAGCLEIEARAAGRELCRIAVTEVAEEVRLDMPDRKELLLASFALFAGGEELFVQPRVVKPRERTAI